MLRVEGVAAGYDDVPVLWDVSLEVGAGEVVALIGANGAGKSTLLRCISGLVPARAGRITFDGHEITDWDNEERVRLGISHVREGRRLFAGMSVRQNLLLGAYLRRDRAGVARDLEMVYDVFPVLKARARQPAGTLSGGEQQMCAVGRGLMSAPRLLLVDELSLGLAPLLVEMLGGVVDRIHAAGTSVLLVDQDVQMALEHAARGYVVETGRVTLHGPAGDLLASPHIRAAYLGL